MDKKITEFERNIYEFKNNMIVEINELRERNENFYAKFESDLYLRDIQLKFW
jgi:hypothetical protein